LRAVLLRGIDRQWVVTDRYDKYRPLIERLENAPFCRPFSSPLVIAVGAVGILASFTGGLGSLSVYPSAGKMPMHPLASDYINP
jgi:hypothetical protein